MLTFLGHAPKLGLVLVFIGSSALSAQTIVLDNFNSGTATGAVDPGTSWASQVTQNPTSITVGGSANDQNGWFASAQSINATGMNFISITAQRDAGHTAPSFVVLFEDAILTTPFPTFSINTSAFITGVMTTVQIPITTWTPGFDITHISGWSIGGGSPGFSAFHMTIDNLSLSATAIPEPGTYAAMAGAFVLTLAYWQRRRAALVAESLERTT